MAGALHHRRRGPSQAAAEVDPPRRGLPERSGPLNDLSIERLRRPVVEDLIATVAERAPRRAEVSGVTEAGPPHPDRQGQEREPRFLTWTEVEELRSWVPEYVARIIPVSVLTMLRRGEVLGLRDADIDLENGRRVALLEPAMRAATAVADRDHT